MNATTITEYVAAKPVTVDVVTFHGTETDRDGWEHNRYAIRVSVDGRSSEADWRQGLGITTSPDDVPADVFAALVSDAASVDNADGFEDWARELGYDEDSRRAYAIYEACRKQRDELITVLGSVDEYEAVAALENDR